jgi:hypothetical protein
MISRKGYNPGPLRLLQQDLSSSNTLLVGTLFEGVDATEGFCVDENGQEQVLLLVASLHLSDIVWRIMELGDGLRPQILRRIHHDPMDPSYGMYYPTALICLPYFIHNRSIIDSMELLVGSWSPKILHWLFCIKYQ